MKAAMDRHPDPVAWAVALVVAAVGCESPECEELCREARSCPSSASDPAECPTACADVAALNGVTECSDSYDDLLVCLESDGVCSATVCSDEQSAWFECTSLGCRRHPEAEACIR